MTAEKNPERLVAALLRLALFMWAAVTLLYFFAPLRLVGGFSWAIGVLLGLTVPIRSSS